MDGLALAEGTACDSCLAGKVEFSNQGLQNLGVIFDWYAAVINVTNAFRSSSLCCETQITILMVSSSNSRKESLVDGPSTLLGATNCY